MFVYSIYKVCDGIADCYNEDVNDRDKSDETNCDAWVCIEPMIKCHDAPICIWRKAVCDGSYDCPSGSDELCTDPCSQHLAPDIRSAYILDKCTNNEQICIPTHWFCDGKKDCPLGSDESDCGYVLHTSFKIIFSSKCCKIHSMIEATFFMNLLDKAR